MNKDHMTSKNIEKGRCSFVLATNGFATRKKFTKQEATISNLSSVVWNKISKGKYRNGIFFSNNSFLVNLPSAKGTICFNIEIYDLCLKIHLDESFIEHFLDGVISLNEFVHLPEELQCLIVDDGINNLIKSMGVTLPNPNKNLNISKNQGKKEALGYFSFNVYREQHALGRVNIEFDSKSSAQLETIVKDRDFQFGGKKTINTFPVFCRIVIDTVFIKRKTMSQLSQGDVLLTNLRSDDTLVIIYFSKKTLFHAKINNEQLELTKKGVPGMQSIEKNEIQEDEKNVSKELTKKNSDRKSNEDQSGNERKASAAENTENIDVAEANDVVKLGDIDIELTFDLGNAEVSLSDIPSIKPGYILEMPNSYERHVYIRNSGRLIAIGELVQVGESLGVEISEIKYGIS